MTTIESLGLMEPMLPPDGERKLEDLAMDLATKASGLASQLPPAVRRSVGDLVRSMNCYYSNLIEGHDTHPRDIDRALAHSDYSADPEKRALQHEAVAHIEVQRLIDHHEDLRIETTSVEYITWLHHEFCKRLPEELLWVQNPDTGEKLRVVAGELRKGGVQVGKHIPPRAEALPRFLKRFEEAYDIKKMSRGGQIIALGAAHHRLLWIHPFYDGNGRVTRLMSHASLLRCGVGSSLWSVARGLARNVQEYKALLMAADAPRRGDLDGRGTLSTQTLIRFCAFFMTICIDQVDFMASLLEPGDLVRRMRLHIEEEVQAGTLPKGSFPLLREALLTGDVPRGRAGEITSYGERMARNVVSDLIKKGYFKSESSRAPLVLAFPIDAVERWFPKLYPSISRIDSVRRYGSTQLANMNPVDVSVDVPWQNNKKP
ncbi:MAG: Fic family protein [Desulfobulbus sp.]|nr:Fic family protein [Desulfobulbus sp.]